MAETASSPKLTARQEAALARNERMNEIARAATATPTPEEVQQLVTDLARARDATTELAEAYQRLNEAYRRLEQQKLCSACAQVVAPEPRRKQVTA